MKLSFLKHLKNFQRLYVGSAATYAIGTWTVVGACAYQHFYGREEVQADTQQVTEDKEEIVDRFSTEEQAQKEKPKGFHTHSTVIYKEGFVPYSTRLFNYLNTLNGGPESTVGSSAKSEK